MQEELNYCRVMFKPFSAGVRTSLAPNAFSSTRRSNDIEAIRDNRKSCIENDSKIKKRR